MSTQLIDAIDFVDGNWNPVVGNAAHDVSKEARAKDGEWTKGGSGDTPENVATRAAYDASTDKSRYQYKGIETGDAVLALRQAEKGDNDSAGVYHRDAAKKEGEDTEAGKAHLAAAALHKAKHEAKKLGSKKPKSKFNDGDVPTTEDVESAVDHYYESAMDINGWLKSGRKSDYSFERGGEDEIKAANVLISALKHYVGTVEFNKPSKVYRGIVVPGEAKKLASLKPGDMYTDKGLISTSTRERTAKKYAGGGGQTGEVSKDATALITIHVPKGTHALKVDDNEKEMLFSPDSKMRVVSVTKVGNRHHVTVDLLRG